MIFPKEREPYPGENTFPGFTISFVSNGGELIPAQKGRIMTGEQNESPWDVLVGIGAVWQEMNIF